MFGAGWTSADGRSSLASDPAWAQMLRWQKDLVDWYGYEDLVKFQATVGEEFAPTNGFATGRLAMCIDGEWRIAFLAADAPELDYQTAPLPVADARPELYGSSYVSGSIIGIPERAGLRDEAWQLVKYLSTDDHALAMLSNGLRNLPSTHSAMRSHELTSDERFAVFLGIFAHPHSSASPIGLTGEAYDDTFSAFVEEWQAGRVADLQGGLRETEQLIDAQRERASLAAGSAPPLASKGSLVPIVR
jgi:multiple sugar transport system substrate-binding protein